MNYYGALLRQDLRYSFVVRLVRLIPLLGLSSYSIHTNSFYSVKGCYA